MLDLLLGLLPDAARAAVTAALLVLGTAVVLGLLYRRFSTRKALLVRAFGQPAGEFGVDGRALADALRDRLRAIWSAHASDEGLYAQAETTSIGDPKRRSEALGSRTVSLLAGRSPLGFLVDVSARLWPVLELEGEVVIGQERELVCHARLRRGDRYFHAWSAPLPRPPRRPRTGADGSPLGEVVEELAYRIVLDASRLRVLDESRGAGTRSWRAFRALTEAMRLWTSPDFRPDDPASVARVDARLAEALEHDPDYALASYDRGILHLLTFRDAESNARARAHL
ncbi:MAG TPA: hypothetical protein VKA44_03750, partial [Gemmatimonadota bacterium]|nr:hypothetical protein [Gemmatimonadota bacterium]